MIGPFYFAPFHDKMLLTNDSGHYAFLSNEDFQLLIKDEKRIDPSLLEELEGEGFCFFFFL